MSNVIKWPHCLVVALVCLQAPASAQDSEPQRHELRESISKTAEIEYVVYLPNGYEESGETWPLFFYLHGGGLAGGELSDLESQMEGRFVSLELPVIVAAPLLPNNGTWDPEILNVILDRLFHDYRVDVDRVYLSGHSRGGNGSWKFGTSYPDRFAAVILLREGVSTACAASVRSPSEFSTAKMISRSRRSPPSRC